jgi:hypothetical protein
MVPLEGADERAGGERSTIEWLPLMVPLEGAPMSGPLHPSQGARFLFERRSVAPDQSSATYRASVITPGERFEYDVVLRVDGSAELIPAGPPAARAWEERLANHARQTARAAERRRADHLAPWPPRLLRWRAP